MEDQRLDDGQRERFTKSKPIQSMINQLAQQIEKLKIWKCFIYHQSEFL